MKEPKTILESEWALVASGGDWEALYRDGVLVRQGHSFCTEDIFSLFGVSLDYITADPTSPNPHPKNLSDVIPFDSKAALRRLEEEGRLSKIALIEKEIADRMKKLDALRGVT